MWSRKKAFLVFLLVFSGSAASAGDQEGCQFCHRLEIHRSSGQAKGGDLRVWEAPGGLHDPLYCSDCHLDARIAPHPATPGPATCIGDCHGSTSEDRSSHQRASFGGGIEFHRNLSAPRAPCLLCHRASDKKGDTETIGARCGGCHPAEKDSVERGVHARFFRGGTGGMCARCHRAHPDGEDAPKVSCDGEGCHGKVTGTMRRLAEHEKKGAAGESAGKIPRAGVFLFIIVLGWASGRFLSPATGGKP